MYITLYVITSILLFLSWLSKKKYIENTSVFIIILFISLLLASRDTSIGVDTISYLEIFKSMNDISTYLESNSFGILGDKLEYVFSLWVSLIKSSGGDFFIFLFISYIIMLSILQFTANKLNVSSSLFFICFLCSYSFIISYLNVFRQGIALSFIFLSYSFFIQNKNSNSFIFLIFATLIHSSAILFFPIFIISKILEKKIAFNIKNYFFFMSIILGLSVIGKTISIIPWISGLFSSNISSRIIFYQDTSSYSAPIYTPSFFLDFLFFFFFFFKGLSRTVHEDKTIRLSIIIYYLGVILYITISSIGVIAERLLLLFSIFQIYPWVKYFSSIEKQKNLNVLLLILVCILFSFKNIYFTTRI